MLLPVVLVLAQNDHKGSDLNKAFNDHKGATTTPDGAFADHHAAATTTVSETPGLAPAASAASDDGCAAGTSWMSEAILRGLIPHLASRKSWTRSAKDHTI